MTRRLPRIFRRSPPPLSCQDVAEVLQRYLDHHVDDDLARRIDAHLDDCRRCGLEADTYRRIKSSLASRRGAVPEDAIERLRQFSAQLSRGDELTDGPDVRPGP